jgi:tRNA (guanine37-N1)-methyltransferase
MTYKVQIVTLVPDLWPQILSGQSGLTGRAFARGSASLNVIDLRRYGLGPHRQVDDAPFGGGAGMVLRVEPLRRAIDEARGVGPVVLLDPRGRRFDQHAALALAAEPGMTLVCGRYEGVDERVRAYCDREVCIGDYVLSAGDPAAWCVIDAVVRLLPGVLGNVASVAEESFSGMQLEYPQYTRPAEYEGSAVPEVLRSGDHAAITAWRTAAAEDLTARLRPDLRTEQPRPQRR